MNKYDYEIAGYCVQYDFVGESYSEKKFDDEEEAIEFAKAKYKEGYEVRVQRIENIIGW